MARRAHWELDLEEADGVGAGVGREGVEEAFAEGFGGGELLLEGWGSRRGLGWVLACEAS